MLGLQNLGRSSRHLARYRKRHKSSKLTFFKSLLLEMMPESLSIDVTRGQTRPGRCSAARKDTFVPESNPLEAVRGFVMKQFLPIGLLLAVLLGYLLPEPAVAAKKINLAQWSTLGIFFISGLQLRRGEIMQALVSWRAFLFGLVSILFITPWIGRAALALPLRPEELGFGLAVFCAMPTSLSSNIALASAVGANTAMSLLLTTASNVIAVFTVPFVLSSVLGTAAAISFNPVTMVKGLMVTVLLPLFMGASFRLFGPVRDWVAYHKELLKYLSTLCLVIVPYTQIGVARYSGSFQAVSFSHMAALAPVILSGLALMRVFNGCAVEVFNLGSRQAEPQTIKRAVVLAASQKTLPIAVAVNMQLAAITGMDAGLATIPCVFAHLSQVVMDSFLVSWWRRQDEIEAAKVPSMPIS